MKKIKIRMKSTIVGLLSGMAIIAAMLFVFGFDSKQGDEDTVRVVESLEDGTMMQAYAAAPVLSMQSVTLDAGMPDETGAEGETPADAESVGISDPERNVEHLDADKDYLEDMSEDELKELSREALDASGKDTALAEGDLETGGITFELPEGFMAAEGEPGTYVLKRYPIDASNVRYVEMDADYTLQLMDEDYFRDMMEDMLASGYGSDVAVKVDEFKHVTIDDVPAVRAKVEYDLEDNHVTQLMVAVNGSRTYMLIYTQTHDYDRMEEFEASADTIRVTGK